MSIGYSDIRVGGGVDQGWHCFTKGVAAVDALAAAAADDDDGGGGGGDDDDDDDNDNDDNYDDDDDAFLGLTHC